MAVKHANRTNIYVSELRGVNYRYPMGHALRLTQATLGGSWRAKMSPWLITLAFRGPILTTLVRAACSLVLENVVTDTDGGLGAPGSIDFHSVGSLEGVYLATRYTGTICARRCSTQSIHARNGP